MSKGAALCSWYLAELSPAFRVSFPASIFIKSRDSSVGIALGYGLDDRGCRVRFPAAAGNFSLHHRVQNSSGAHPASYPMGTRGSFFGGKTAGAWSWPLTSIYCRCQRMSGAIPALPQYAFMAGCSVKAQGHLYLYLNFFIRPYCNTVAISCCVASVFNSGERNRFW
jgi:hypothetical protein